MKCGLRNLSLMHKYKRKKHRFEKQKKHKTNFFLIVSSLRDVKAWPAAINIPATIFNYTFQSLEWLVFWTVYYQTLHSTKLCELYFLLLSTKRNHRHIIHQQTDRCKKKSDRSFSRNSTHKQHRVCSDNLFRKVDASRSRLLLLWLQERGDKYRKWFGGGI